MVCPLWAASSTLDFGLEVQGSTHVLPTRAPVPIDKVAHGTPTSGPTCAYNGGMKNGDDMNNLYILEGVLADYTGGMAVVAAPSLERAWEVFAEHFGFRNLEREKQFCEDIKVIKGVNHAEGVVSYMYGGS